MKHIKHSAGFIFHTIFLALLFTGTFFAEAKAEKTLTLAENGETDYVIILPADASLVQKTAARELHHFLREITGAEFPVVTEDSEDVDAAKKRIILGPSASSQKILGDEIRETDLAYDAILLKTAGDTLVLSGHPRRGTLYAVYTFLEDFCGCRWWTAQESFIPKKPELKIPPINVAYAPKLIYRESHYRGSNDAEFAARMKNNGALRPVSEEFGGKHRFQYFVHSFYPLIPPEKYFEEHPEWFSEIGGKRTADGGQLCLTNEEMTREMIENAKAALRGNPDATFISVSQNDWYGYCQCEKCAKIAEEEGSQAGLLLRFVNRVAEEIGKEFPDVFVETLAYQYTRKPPKITRPRANVVVRLCSIECSFAQTLAEGAQNADFRDDMIGWSEIAEHLFVWDYVTNFPSYMLPHPNYHVLAPNIRFFVDHRVIGLFEQGDDHCVAGDLVRMRNWMISKLLWNPDLDESELRREFISGYYGEEFLPFFEKYFALMEKEMAETGFYLGIFRTQTSDWLRCETLTETLRLWNEMETLAKKLEAEHPGITAKIRRERIPVDFVWIMESCKYRVQAKLQGASLEELMPEMAELVPDFIARLDENNVQLFREWNGDISLLKPELLQKMQAAGTVPTIPDFCKTLPENSWLDIQQDAFHLHLQGEWTDVAADENASDTLAVRMPGDHYEWAASWRIPGWLSLLRAPSSGENAEDVTPAVYRVYAYVRSEGPADSGPAMTLGIWDTKENKSVAHRAPTVEEIGGSAYQKIDLGAYPLTPDQYFWAAPPKRPGEVTAVYVDRLIVVRE